MGAIGAPIVLSSKSGSVLLRLIEQAEQSVNAEQVLSFALERHFNILSSIMHLLEPSSELYKHIDILTDRILNRSTVSPEYLRNMMPTGNGLVES
ncbi:MAG: hypothetical protein OQK82_00425 [Candidatus Pacearchaeota archaeon]|nr:hypothetical protein [Candidatus Pacearchaeota archaeon]